MMKLYLSSYRIPTFETLQRLLPKDAGECNVGIIRNAKDFRADQENEQAKLHALSKDLHDVGFRSIFFIDLLNVESDFSFDHFDVVYAAGGNTFALNYAIHSSGHDKTLKHFINTGGVYVGESAGAIITGSSIDKFDSVDDKKAVPYVYKDGLGILDAVICPHADSPEYAEEVERTADHYVSLGYEVITLNDNQAYVVNGDKSWVDTGVYFGDENRSRS